MARFTYPAGGGGGGDVSFTGEGCIVFPNDGEICNTADSSGDGSGLSTMSINPDTTTNDDRYITIDPTGPNHIHIRAGGDIDNSSAMLILGGEKNSVVVDDSSRAVGISTLTPQIINTYLNTNAENSTQLITDSTADIQTGYTVNVDGTDYVVDTVTPIDEGTIAVTASGAVFTNRTSYTFIFEPDYNNQWVFASDGTFFGPAMGMVKVQGIYGQNVDPLLILGPASVILDGDAGEFLNDASVPSNQIATIGDIQSANVADFVFTDVDSANSSMTITGDKEMTIESGSTNDLNVRAGDQLWLTAGNDVILQADDTVQIRSLDGVEILSNYVDQGDAEHTWEFTTQGELKLPGGGVILSEPESSSDNASLSTLMLVPDGTIETNQVIVVDPTGPNHIHLRAGGTIDESDADLVLGGERNNVYVSDNGRSVSISTRPAQVINSYVNENPTSDTNFIVSNSAIISEGDTFSYPAGEEPGIFTVTSVTNNTPTAELMTVTATGLTFITGGTYVFTHEDPWNNQWEFTDNGYLSGPADGGLYASAIINRETDLWIASKTSVVLQGLMDDAEAGGEFLNDPNIPGNQIAVLDDLSGFVYLSEPSEMYSEQVSGPVTDTRSMSGLYEGNNWDFNGGMNGGNIWPLAITEDTQWLVDNNNSIVSGVITFADSTTVPFSLAGLGTTNGGPGDETIYDVVTVFSTEVVNKNYTDTYPLSISVVYSVGSETSTVVTIESDITVSPVGALTLSSSGVAFINDPTVASNQIATIGDISDTVSGETTFVVNGGTLGTQPTFSGSPLFSGSYVKVGSLVHFQIQVDMDNITNFGTGQYYVDLPFPAKYGYQVREGCLHDISTDRQYGIGGHVFAGQSQLRLNFTNSNGQDEAFDYNSPITLTVADNFHIAGSYICE